MATRLDLHAMLVNILGSGNVYFQPPGKEEMQYPAIAYTLGGINNKHADNSVYFQTNTYTVTVIDYDPDSRIKDDISKLPRCKFDRSYTTQGLNHFVFKLNY